MTVLYNTNDMFYVQLMIFHIFFYGFLLYFRPKKNMEKNARYVCCLLKKERLNWRTSRVNTFLC